MLEGLESLRELGGVGFNKGSCGSCRATVLQLLLRGDELGADRLRSESHVSRKEGKAGTCTSSSACFPEDSAARSSLSCSSTVRRTSAADSCVSFSRSFRSDSSVRF